MTKHTACTGARQDSFGLEAIDTLVKGMEDHPGGTGGDPAGYTREMETFLTANSGLASRFPNQIEFPDYTPEELLDITTVQAKARGYRLDEGCTFPLWGYYKRRQALDSRTAGQRASGPQHPGKGDLQPEPPPDRPAGSPAGSDPGRRPGV